MTNNISEFEQNGFVRSHHNTINKLRSSPHRKYFRIFNSAMINTNRRNPKYSARDIFGDFKLVYYYDERRENEFINFLVERFYEKNPQPDQYMRSAFTRILHQHNLCWQGCHHGAKKCII